MVGSGATAREREGEERGTAAELTAITQSSTAGSGMPGSSRITGEGPRRPESNLASAMASAMVGIGATARKRGGEERGNGKKLTAITQSSTAGSGKTW